jgi:hypothetical protein
MNANVKNNPKKKVVFFICQKLNLLKLEDIDVKPDHDLRKSFYESSLYAEPRKLIYYANLNKIKQRKPIDKYFNSKKYLKNRIY